MKKQNHVYLMSLITLFTLLANLAFPATAYADDETPPPPTEEPAQPPLNESTEEVLPAQEELVIAEFLGGIPDETEVVVLNENGDIEPLATEEAAEIIVESDPMWCPAGTTTVTADCVYAGTVTALLPLLASKDGDGTIYFFTPVTYNTNDVTFDGLNADIDQLADNSLTLQGGWNGTTTLGSTISFSGPSVFSVPVKIYNWAGSVTVNDFTVSGAGDTGLFIDNTDDTGTVTIQDGDFSNNSGAGVGVRSNNDILLTNVTASNNPGGFALGQGAFLDTSNGTGDIILTGTNEFNNNATDGLFAFSADDISLHNVTANENGAYGAYLESCGCTADSHIVLTGSNVFNDNDFMGLNAFTDGNITVSNVTANGNDDTGANLFATGNIVINGTNEFNNNGLGLYVESESNITLSNVSANYNDYNGAWLDNTYGSGNVTITNSFFDWNVVDDEDAGLNVDSNGFITLSGVSASNNGGDGAEIGYEAGLSSSGSWSGVLIKNSVFNNNSGVYGYWGYGVYMAYGSGNVSVQNVTAVNNLYSGLYLDTTGSIFINASSFNDSQDESGVDLSNNGNAIICNSTFSNNYEYGVDADNLGGTLTLNNIVFIGNGTGDYTYSGSPIFGNDCKPTVNGNNGGPGLPMQIIPVNGGGGAEFDCELFAGTTFVLSSGDKVTFKCPIDGEGVLDQLKNDGLPGKLPDGVEYVSGMQADQSPDGSDTPLNGLVIISFVIPQDMQSEDFAILYFDGSDWVDLQSAAFEDGRTVFNAGFATENGYFEGVTNFSGNFILVKK